jgi:hypothetical protein
MTLVARIERTAARRHARWVAQTLLAVTLGLRAASAEAQPVAGDPLPWFAALPSDGPVLHRDALLHDLPADGLLVISFAASWCDACEVRLRSVTRWRAERPELGRHVRVVVVGATEAPETTEAWLRAAGLTFRPVLPDPFGTIAVDLGAASPGDEGLRYQLPYAIIADARGRIVAIVPATGDLIEALEAWADGR